MAHLLEPTFKCISNKPIHHWQGSLSLHLWKLTPCGFNVWKPVAINLFQTVVLSRSNHIYCPWKHSFLTLLQWYLLRCLFKASYIEPSCSKPQRFSVFITCVQIQLVYFIIYCSYLDPYVLFFFCCCCCLLTVILIINVRLILLQHSLFTSNEIEISLHFYRTL